MLIQWFIIRGKPLVYVTADTRLMCQRLAFEIGSMLPTTGVISPKQDHKTRRWSQGFSLEGIDVDVAAKAISGAIRLGGEILRGSQLTPPMGTPLSLIKETK